MSLKKYFSIGKIDMLERYSYFWENTFSIFILVLIVFVLAKIWTAIFSQGQTIDGFTLVQIIWYICMTELIVASTSNEKIEDIGNEIRSGELSNTLLKPLNYLGKQFAIMFSGFFYRFITIGIIVFILAYLLAGAIPLTFSGIILTIIIIIFGAILNFCIVLIFAMLALWLEDSSSIYWIYQKTVFIIGGMLIPLDFYPTWIKSILIYLPTSYVVYFPAKTFVHFSSSLFFTSLIGQIIWIAIFIVILTIIYKIGIKKVSIHGG